MSPRRVLTIVLVVLVMAGLVAAKLGYAQTADLATDFFLRDGDRVVFYGDSITEQGHFIWPLELFVRIRRPAWDIEFINRGWAGDRAWGGDGGMLDERLQRDVISLRPTVVVAMLGMNDGYYTNSNPAAVAAFRAKLDELTVTLQRDVPGVRITLIGASPYDNVTPGDQPDWERNIAGGYNSVVKQFSLAAKEVAGVHQLQFVDMNAPLAELLSHLQATEPQLARQLIPDRIHPGPAAGLAMTIELLAAWNAPAATEIAVHGCAVDGSTANQWIEVPLPFAPLVGDRLATMVLQSHSAREFCRGPRVRVVDVSRPRSLLNVDGQPLGEFPAAELPVEIDRALHNAAVTANAAVLAELIQIKNQLQFARWRESLPAARATAAAKSNIQPVAATAEERIAKLFPTLAQPVRHTVCVFPADHGQ